MQKIVIIERTLLDTIDLSTDVELNFYLMSFDEFFVLDKNC